MTETLHEMTTQSDVVAIEIDDHIATLWRLIGPIYRLVLVEKEMYKKKSAGGSIRVGILV